MVIIVMFAPVPKRLLSHWWNRLIRSVSVAIAPMTPVSGHGLLFTMRNGWCSCIDIS